MPNFRKPGVVIDLQEAREARRAARAHGPPPTEHPGTGHNGGPPLNEAAEVRELALDLTQLTLDLAGIVEPTPFCDGTSMLISLGRGHWWDAVLSGVSIVPYVGDLAKAGKLPKYLRTLERVVEYADRSKEFALRVLPAVEKLKKLLDLFPRNTNAQIEKMRLAVERFLLRHGKQATRAADELPRVGGKRFLFENKIGPSGNSYKVASGKLAIPSKIAQDTRTGAQRISSGTGDHAGHLIARRFGGPATAENLSLQNKTMNTYASASDHVGKGGAYYQQEERWAHKLEEGWGVEVKITDVTRPGETRPFNRIAEWTETSPAGEVTHYKVDYSNPHSVASRTKQGIAPTVPPGNTGTVLPFKRN